MPADFRFEPATAAHWKDLQALFGERGACGGCWCMSWRKPKERFQREKGAAKKTATAVSGAAKRVAKAKGAETNAALAKSARGDG